MGRFLTRDPVRDGRNPYAYCGGDPVRGADPSGFWSLYRWLYTGDGDALDDVYEPALDQAWRTLQVWTAHFMIDSGVVDPPTATIIGPFPKRWVPNAIARTPMMEGSSGATSGVRVISQKILPALRPAADFVKENQVELWIIVEAGIAWTATIKP